MIGVYLIENSINNKVYVGQSWDIEKRFKSHSFSKEKNVHLKNSYRKYGFSSFCFKILIEVKEDEWTQRLLNFYETYFVLYYDSLNEEKGYNIKFPGSNGKHNAETILKLKNRKVTDETREKLKKSRLGTTLSEDTKIKISKSSIGVNKGRKHTQEEKNKMKEAQIKSHLRGEKHPLFGIGHTEKTKEKIRISKKGKLEGSCNPFYGKKHSEESKEKMRYKNSKKIYSINRNIVYPNSEEASKELNLKTYLIRKICGNKINKEGYSLVFYNENIHKNGNTLFFNKNEYYKFENDTVGFKYHGQNKGQ